MIGIDRVCHAFPGHAFLASLAWPGFAGIAMLLTTLLMQGISKVEEVLYGTTSQELFKAQNEIIKNVI